jgi:hypothetical protein
MNNNQIEYDRTVIFLFCLHKIQFLGMQIYPLKGKILEKIASLAPSIYSPNHCTMMNSNALGRDCLVSFDDIYDFQDFGACRQSAFIYLFAQIAKISDLYW